MCGCSPDSPPPPPPHPDRGLCSNIAAHRPLALKAAGRRFGRSNILFPGTQAGSAEARPSCITRRGALSDSVLQRSANAVSQTGICATLLYITNTILAAVIRSHAAASVISRTDCRQRVDERPCCLPRYRVPPHSVLPDRYLLLMRVIVVDDAITVVWPRTTSHQPDHERGTRPFALGGSAQHICAIAGNPTHPGSRDVLSELVASHPRRQ